MQILFVDYWRLVGTFEMRFFVEQAPMFGIFHRLDLPAPFAPTTIERLRILFGSKFDHYFPVIMPVVVDA